MINLSEVSVEMTTYIVKFDNGEEYADYSSDFLVVSAKSKDAAKAKVQYIIDIEHKLEEKDCHDEEGIGVWQIIDSSFFYNGKIFEILSLAEHRERFKKFQEKAKELSSCYLEVKPQ